MVSYVKDFFWFTKKFIVKLTLGLFLKYSYNLGDFHPDILIVQLNMHASYPEYHEDSKHVRPPFANHLPSYKEGIW